MAQYLNVSHIKKLAKENGKRVGSDFLFSLDVFIEEKVKQACEVHNGSKITLDSSVAGFVGLKKAGKK